MYHFVQAYKYSLYKFHICDISYSSLLRENINYSFLFPFRNEFKEIGFLCVMWAK